MTNYPTATGTVDVVDLSLLLSQLGPERIHALATCRRPTSLRAPALHLWEPGCTNGGGGRHALRPPPTGAGGLGAPVVDDDSTHCAQNSMLVSSLFLLPPSPPSSPFIASEVKLCSLPSLNFLIIPSGDRHHPEALNSFLFHVIPFYRPLVDGLSILNQSLEALA